MNIQNAIQIVSTKEIIKSSHRHDFVDFEIDGEDYFIDGGLDYFRSGGAKPLKDLEKEGKIVDLRLDGNSTIKEIADKLLWGDKFIKDLSEEHLDNIYKDYRTNPNISLIHLFIVEKTLQGFMVG